MDPNSRKRKCVSDQSPQNPLFFETTSTGPMIHKEESTSLPSLVLESTTNESTKDELVNEQNRTTQSLLKKDFNPKEEMDKDDE